MRWRRQRRMQLFRNSGVAVNYRRDLLLEEYSELPLPRRLRNQFAH